MINCIIAWWSKLAIRVLMKLDPCFRTEQIQKCRRGFFFESYHKTAYMTIIEVNCHAISLHFNLKVSIFDNCDSLKDLLDFDLVAPNNLGHRTKVECILFLVFQMNNDVNPNRFVRSNPFLSFFESRYRCTSYCKAWWWLRSQDVHMRQKTNLSSALLYYSFMTLFFQMSSLVPSFPHSVKRVKIFHAKKEVILFSK